MSFSRIHAESEKRLRTGILPKTGLSSTRAWCGAWWTMRQEWGFISFKLSARSQYVDERLAVKIFYR